MNKWIATPVIVVLSLGVIVGGYFLWQHTNKLGEAESEIVALEYNVSTLEGNVSTLEGELTDSQATVATLEGNISTLEGNVSTLEENVSTLEGNVSTLEGNVSTLEGELTDSQATVATLEGNVSTLEGNVSTLQEKLADSQARASTLETDLQAANDEIVNLQADLKTQQTLNLALSEELKTVKDPRHFESLAELTDWLREDDTDTKYADESIAQRCFILQVRALRDGYLLPVSFSYDGTTWWFINQAVVGDTVYLVYLDDSIEEYEYIQPLPSHPLPLD